MYHLEHVPYADNKVPSRNLGRSIHVHREVPSGNLRHVVQAHREVPSGNLVYVVQCTHGGFIREPRTFNICTEEDSLRNLGHVAHEDMELPSRNLRHVVYAHMEVPLENLGCNTCKQGGFLREPSSR